MKDSIKNHLKIERDLKKELSEIEDIMKSDEADAVKLDSIRAILNELAEEIVEERIRAVVDEITGCVTQKFILEFLEKEISEAERYKSNLSIVITDIDFLKYINDTFGHVAGTHVIEKVAEIVKKNARGSDVVSRYGGDEFVIVCPNTDIKGAERLIKRIKKDIEEFKFSKGIKVSLSTGAKEYDSGIKNPHKFLDEVDKILYKAKEVRVNLNLKDNHSS